MTDRLRIFNRHGASPIEFTASVSRSYTIGEQDTATFDVPTDESFFNAKNFAFGNWVLVESDISPAWVGSIGSLVWGMREVTIEAFSPEYFLSRRIGPIEKVVEAAAGMIFSEIISQANKDEVSIVRQGNLFMSQSRQETLNPTPLSDDLRRIYERSGEEYIWRPEITDNGNLIIYGDWSEKLGIDTDFTLHEGTSGGNIEATNRVLIQDAPEGNYIFGYGNGTAWTSRPYFATRDEDSVNKYGLIQKSISYYGVTNISTLEDNVKDEIIIYKNPASIYNVNALDVGNTFEYMKLGNRMNLKMEHVGFTNGNIGTDVRVRVVGMYFDPTKPGKIELALEAYNDTVG